MIAHLCRLAWNRRRSHLLLVAELFLSFLVLTPLTAGWVLFAAERLKPLGFEHENVWSARLGKRDLHGDEREKAAAAHRRNIDLVRRELRASDGVRAVALASQAPLRFSENWNGISSVHLSDDGLDALGLRLLAGRWFEPEDEALDWTPAVIDRELSRALFGGDDPLGRAISDSPLIVVENSYNPPRPDRVRVVGVVESCFYYGSYQDVEVAGFAFLRLSEEWLASRRQSWVNFLVDASPDSGPALGERLRSKVQDLLPAGQSVSFEIQSLTEIRESARGERILFLTIIAVFSGLMMLMVALGLTGIMWQNVRRRTREIGIRRAVGGAGRPHLRPVPRRAGGAGDGGHRPGVRAPPAARAAGHGAREPGAGLSGGRRRGGHGRRPLPGGDAVRTVSELAGGAGEAGRGPAP